MSPLDKPTGEVTGDVGMGDFGGGSTDGLVSTAGELWWAGVGCAICSYDHDYGGQKALKWGPGTF